MSISRFPLVLDYSDGSRIIELPASDSLNLENSDIVGVRNIAVEGGTITIDGVPLSTFSGYYADLVNKPFIPTRLVELGIIDGANDEVLHANGDGTYEFKPITFDYNLLTGLPSIPVTLLDLGIVDGNNGDVLVTDGSGNFTFTNLNQDLFGNFDFVDSTITTTIASQMVIRPNANFLKIDSTYGMVIPAGPDADRVFVNETAAIRFNTDRNVFEGLYQGGNWNILGGLRSVDGRTYVTPESAPGVADNVLQFYTDDIERLHISSTEAVFDPSVVVTVNDLNVNNMALTGGLSLNGDVVIGDGNEDTLTINAEITSSLYPKNNNSFNIGTVDNRWHDFYAEGQAYINNYTLPISDSDEYHIVKTNGKGLLEFTSADTYGGNRVYVSEMYGKDTNNGIDAPVRTIGRATEIASKLISKPAQIDTALEQQIEVWTNNKLENRAISATVAVAPSHTIDPDILSSDINLIVEAIYTSELVDSEYLSVLVGKYLASRSIPFVSSSTTAKIEALDSLDTQIINDYLSNNKDAYGVSIGYIKDIVINGADLGYFISTDSSNIHFENNIPFLVSELDNYITVNNMVVVYDRTAFVNIMTEAFKAIFYDIAYGGTQGQHIALQMVHESVNASALTPAIIVDGLNHIVDVLKNVLLDNILITPSPGNTVTQSVVNTGNHKTYTEVQAGLSRLIHLLTTNDINEIGIKINTTVKPSAIQKDDWRKLQNKIELYSKQAITDVAVSESNVSGLDFKKDVNYIIDSVIYDARHGGNEKTVTATNYFANRKSAGEDLAPLTTALSYIQGQASSTFLASHLVTITTLLNIINDNFVNDTVPPAIITGSTLFQRVGILVSTGDYVEDNPFILPEYVTILGEKGVNVRPANPEYDIIKARDNSNIINITFKDYIDGAQLPVSSWRYAVVLDDISNLDVDRRGYVGMPTGRSTTYNPITIQNCNIISVLGGNGIEINGLLVDTVSTPPLSYTEEDPESGYIALINGLYIKSFGGTGVRSVNNAQVKCLSTNVEFAETGFISQSGGLLELSNCSTSYGFFNLQATGTTSEALLTDIGIFTNYGEIEGKQSLKVTNLDRPLNPHYVIEVRDQTDIDVTNEYENNDVLGIENTFTVSNTSVSNSTITFPAAHNLSEGDMVQYDAQGGKEIDGLKSEVTYYAGIISATEIALFYDANLDDPVVNMDYTRADGTTQRFLTNYEKIFVSEIIYNNNQFQEVTLDQTLSYPMIIVGNTIYGKTTPGSGDQIIAAIADWDEVNKRLLVSLEPASDGVVREFTTNSVIDEGVVASPVTSEIAIVNVVNRSDKWNAHFTIDTSLNQQIRAIGNIIAKTAKFYRPSIVNAIGHKWEFPGSGIDYTALPAHGGNLNRKAEAVQTLPGRVYAQGSNESGDFRIGNLIEAFNKAETIEFNSKLKIQNLEILGFDSTNSQKVTFISNDTGLGQNEESGPSNNRLITQKAVHDYIDDNLSQFMNKRLSDTPITGAVAQLNNRGEIDYSLLPAKSTYRVHLLENYKERLEMHLVGTPINLQAGDIVAEEYQQIVLTLSASVTLTAGEYVQQANTGAGGFVKDDVNNSPTVTLIQPLSGNFSDEVADVISTDLQGALVDPTSILGVFVTEIYGPYAQRDNYIINTALHSQYLVIEGSSVNGIVSTPNFTVKIANGESVSSINSRATGTPTDYIVGACATLDSSVLPLAGNYVDGSYDNVELISVTGTGYGALASVTITSGAITAFSVKRAGSGYTVNTEVRLAEDINEVTVANANFVGRFGGTQITFYPSRVENRLLLNVDASKEQHFVATPGNPDFIEDDSSIKVDITDLAEVHTYDFYGYPVDPTVGGVDTINSYIVFETDHVFANGDYVQYSNNGYPSIGGLTHNQTYYVKSINAKTIELYYTNGLHVNEKVYLTETQYGNHRFFINVGHRRTNQFYLQSHGFDTGDAIKFVAANPPDTVNSTDFFFIGSVTENTFTIHRDYNNSLQSINGNIVRPFAFADPGSGAAELYRMPTRIVEAVNTSGQDQSSWTNMWKIAIDGTDIVTGIVPAQRLGTYTAGPNTFLRGDNVWRNAVERIYTDMPGIVKFSSESEILSGNTYHFSDVKIDISHASYDNPTTPTAGEETAGVASFDFDHFVITDPGHITTKSSVDGGVIDAKYLDGQDGTFWRDPINNSRPIPIEKGGTNLSSISRGSLLYAGDNLGDGSFTQVLSELPPGNDFDIMVSFAGLPTWASNLTLNGLTVRNLLLAVTDDNTISTSTGNLILDSAAGTINVNDNVVMVGSMDITGATGIVGDTTVTGDITTTGYVETGEINVGVTFDNLIDTKSKDLKLDSRTGLTIIDDNLDVVGDLDVTNSVTVTENVTVLQDVGIGSDISVGETATIGLNATINQIQIGVSQANEIDTVTGDLVLDSETGLTLINDDVRITGSVQLDGTLTSLGDGVFNGTQTMNGNVDINGTATVTGDLTVSGNASFEEIRAGVAGPSEIDTTSGNLILDSFTGTVEIDDDVIVNESLTVTGTTTLNNNITVQADTNITGDIVHTGNTNTTGSSSITGSLAIDEIQIGVAGTNEIDTSGNDLILDSFTGETIIDDNLTVTGNLTVSGTMTSVNSTNIEIEDVNILLAKGSGSALNADGAGLTVDIGASSATITTPTLLYVASTDTWDLNKTLMLGANNLETTGTLISSNATIGTITATNINSGSISNSATISSTGMISSDTGFTTAGTINSTGSITSAIGFITPNNITAQGTITATNGFIGNADTASRWFTPRTITFQDSLVDTADVTGSITIDGSTDVQQVVLKLVPDAVEDIVGAMISTNSTHDGVAVVYDDALGTLSFNVDNATLIAATGGMFDSNSEVGVISTFNTVTNKIDFTLDDNVFKDYAGTLFVDNTGNYGVSTSYDTANNNVVFTLIDDDVKDVVGTMATPGIQEGIDVTYDSTNKVFNYSVHDPVISLAGDVTGSATMTNLGDVEITASLSITAVDLGTNTSGDYVQSLVQGDGIRIINQTGESSTPTIEHANTSSVVSTANVSSSANTDIIYNLGFDTFGHVNHVETTNILLFEDYGWNIAVNGTTEDNFKEQSIFNVIAGNNVTLSYDTGTSSLTITTLDTIYEGWNLFVDDVNRGLIATQNNVNHKAGNNVTLTYNATNNTITYASSYKDTDTKITGVSFDTSTGVLSFARERYDDTSGTTATTALTALTVDLDNRYTVIGNEIDTLATVTARGATTTSNVTVGTLNTTDSITITGATSETINFASGAVLGSNSFNCSLLHGTGTSGVIISNNKNVTPASTNDHNLGTSTVRWNTVYASVFDGVATTAQYADLAEMYLPDKDYKPGTIVELGGEAEITETTITGSRRICGVISTAPAYLMNSELKGGLPVALKGRVPVYVTGKVQKGDFIISSHIPGVGRSSEVFIEAGVIGKAIEAKHTDDIQLIEVLIGVN